MARELTGRQREALRRLREKLDVLDRETRRPGEPPLREQVAEQAREELERVRGDG